MKHPSWLYIIACLLLLPALLINIGVLTFIDDEAIRSLVAMEMKLSDNFITPTLLGEYYYNKPPLFNWIILATFNLFGNYSEYTARLPTVLALLGYSATIFYFLRKHFDTASSFLAVFIFITCGRILFWDSLLALIDITFSWVIFTSFMVIYHFFEKKKFTHLFVFSYLLIAVGFLLKGLPAVVFQATTLLIYFWYRRRFKTLFSLNHVLGIVIFIAIVGGYYWTYHQYNGLDHVLPTLFVESSKRTIVNYGFLKTITHLFTFPFEMVYHFLPWSLLIIYFFNHQVLHWIREKPFVIFCLLAFCGNIIVYWTSPEVYPRYLLMLAPLLFIVFTYLHEKHRGLNSWQYRFLRYLFLTTMVLICLASIAPLLIERTQSVSYLFVKTASIAISCLALSLIYYQSSSHHFSVLVVFLLLIRIAFNWFVLPDRNNHDFGDLCRKSSEQIGKKYATMPLFVYKETDMQPTNSFYITKERQQIVRRKYRDFKEGDLYIIDPDLYPDLIYEKIDEMQVRHGQLTYDIGKLLMLN